MPGLGHFAGGLAYGEQEFQLESKLFFWEPRRERQMAQRPSFDNDLRQLIKPFSTPFWRSPTKSSPTFITRMTIGMVQSNAVVLAGAVIISLVPGTYFHEIGSHSLDE